jgi:hypothetical protein
LEGGEEPTGHAFQDTRTAHVVIAEKVAGFGKSLNGQETS